MKKNIYLPILALTLSAMLGSCEKFLDEVPDARTEIDTPEKIQNLLGTAYPNALYFDMCETMSDNAGEKEQLSESSVYNTQLYSWKTISESNQYDIPGFYWNSAYEAIASANHALEAVEKLGGGAELDYLKGEALVARAYAHFMLGVLWCKPFNPATANTDLGLPYVTKAEKKVFETYRRIPLSDYYSAIEKDLLEGLPLIVNTKYKQPKYHFTTEAAHAFATRFYLMKGDWDKVIEHADAALGNSASTKLRDVYGQKSLTYAQKRNLYSSSNEVANALVVGALSSYNNYMALNKYGVNVTIKDLLSSSASHPLGQSWAYTFYGGDDYANIPKYQEYFKYTNISIGIGSRYNMAVLFSYDEVFLNRLEAYLMKGEKAKFLSDLLVMLKTKTEDDLSSLTAITETFLNNRYHGKGTALAPAYTLSTQQREWLQCVVDVRRMVFLFEGLRWFDNKRFNMEITHQKGSETMVLSATDPRRELQIPEDAQNNGISANPR